MSAVRDDQNSPRDAALSAAMAKLAREASIEINVQDTADLEAARSLIGAGRKMYVSHLPKQSWRDTIVASHEVRAAGFDPVPHIPVRLLDGAKALDELLASLRDAGVEEALFIAGDYPGASGPYSSVMDVMRGGAIQRHGFKRISIAGHPEGHPQVATVEIRRAEQEKASWAAAENIQAHVLTQFFFESASFIEWAADFNSKAPGVKLVAGLAGPASAAKLLRFAMRCGVGPSIRALSNSPRKFGALLTEHSPQDIIADLARAKLDETAPFEGIHLFCFGGFVRTAQWLRELGDGSVS